jgi:hypothetical protein
MKVPTTGTSVFTPLALNNASGTVNTTGFPIDLQMQFYRSGGIGASNSQWVDRLRGFSSTSTQTGPRLYTPSTDAENDSALGTLFNNTGFSTSGNWANIPMAYWNFRRAPGFFDEVCYTGNGSTQAPSHNLTQIPELLIVKRRSGTGGWATLATNASVYGYINSSGSFFAASTGINQFGNGTVYVPPTSTAFTVGPDTDMNGSGSTYVAYLFATCPGVSKVGSYTGTGATQVINCGFTGGARFVLIKATSTTGDWYVWDSARGIVAGNDPYLALNSTAAEVTTTDWVDTAATGFELSNAGGNLANSNGVSYIFLAIA